MSMTLVGMSLKQAQWLGSAPSTIGGCVAVSDAGRDCARIVGYDCIGVVPSGWLESDAEYHPLTKGQIKAVYDYLAERTTGWSGANEVNTDRDSTRKMLDECLAH